MNVLVIFAHPNNQSFCAALKEAFLRGLKDSQQTVRVQDLYALQFDPLLRTDELLKKETKKTTSSHHLEDNLREDLRWAELITIIHPVWWYGAPAILKGYFDRILSEGFAYNYKNEEAIPLLTGKKGLLIQTFDAEEKIEKELLEDISYKNIFFTWRYCGVTDWRRWQLFRVSFVARKQREEWLKEAYELGKNITTNRKV